MTITALEGCGRGRRRSRPSRATSGMLRSRLDLPPPLGTVPGAVSPRAYGEVAHDCGGESFDAAATTGDEDVGHDGHVAVGDGVGDRDQCGGGSAECGALGFEAGRAGEAE